MAKSRVEPETVNRIYQGRVKRCEFVEYEKSDRDAPRPDGDGPTMLLRHHEVYQDAANYYMVALAAMAPDAGDSFFAKYKRQVGEVWDDFYRNGQKRPGLKHSLIRTLGHTAELDAKGGAARAMALMLEGNDAGAEVRAAALEHIANHLGGDVGRAAKTYWPRLCNSGYTGNWDCDAKALGDDANQARLYAIVNGDAEAAAATLRQLAGEITPGWAGVKTNDKVFAGQEAKESLKEAVGYFAAIAAGQGDAKAPAALRKWLAASAAKERLADYLAKVEKLGDIQFPRNNKAALFLRHAVWLLRFFPDAFTVELMRRVLKKPKSDKKDEAGATPAFADDPVKLARGRRGFVFPAFTALPTWSAPWPCFDMEALMEALKTINQIQGKSSEREEELRAYQEKVAWMEPARRQASPCGRRRRRG